MIKLTRNKLLSTVAALALVGLTGCEDSAAPAKQEAAKTEAPKAEVKAAAKVVSQQQTISASQVKDDLEFVRLSDPVWANCKANKVTVYPQTTVKVNDRNANELNKNRGAKDIRVRAVTNGEYLAMKVCWKDDTQSIQSGTETDEYPDGFAIQLPVDFSNLDRLPYIGMGSPDRPVMVYLRKAVSEHYEPNAFGDIPSTVNERNTHAFDSELGNYLEKFRMDSKSAFIKRYERVFISEGFRSMTQVRDGGAPFRTEIKYNEDKLRWEALIVRPLNDRYTKLYTDTFPVAFAVWDGEKLNRDGLKHISPWTAIKVEGSKGSQAIEQLMGQVNADVPDADLANGEKLTKMYCASCHRFAEVQDAPQFMAPNLENIGGYSTTEYLKESITKPNNVVVSGYNRNAHPAYKWYYDDGNGGRMSAMPAFDYLQPNELRDIVGYLKTLKAEVK